VGFETAIFKFFANVPKVIDRILMMESCLKKKILVIIHVCNLCFLVLIIFHWLQSIQSL